MSSVLTFVYDYQSAKDIVRHICLKGARVGKAYLPNVNVNFYDGYIGYKTDGKYNLDGVLFNFVTDDFYRFKQFVDLQYPSDIIEIDVKSGSQTKRVKTFVPKNKGSISLPGYSYYEKLTATYDENGFDTKTLEISLARAFILTYPEMKKYRMIERRKDG